jgi:hypothetical protein
MDPVEIQTSVVLSRVASETIPFDRAVERSGVGTAGLFGGATLLDAMEAAWTPKTNVTVTTPAGVKANCNKMAIASGFTTGLVATQDFAAAVDLSADNYMNFLIKASIAVTAGVLQIGVSETAVMGGSPNLTDIPALAADQWYYISLAYTGAGSTRNATLSVGINAVSDPGTVDVYLDEVRSSPVQFLGIAGFADDDEAVEDDQAVLYDNVKILARGHILAELAAGITCVAEQKLFPIPGLGSLTTIDISMDGPTIRASEDQATAAGRVGVIV